MTFHIIDNPNHKATIGFTSAQFRKLDGLYLQAASDKTLTYRTVDCDFDEGIATYTYYKSQHYSALLQFIIRKVGPHTMHYELFKQGKGCIAKSGLFERTFDRLSAEIESLKP